MQNRWETDVLQREVSRTAINERSWDRWGVSNDTQISSIDINGASTSPSGKFILFERHNFNFMKFISSHKSINIQ